MKGARDALGRAFPMACAGYPWGVPEHCCMDMGTVSNTQEMPDIGIVVVVRGSKLSMKTVLLPPKSDVSAFIWIPPYAMTCGMPLTYKSLLK